jgi:hypothetical protein
VLAVVVAASVAGMAYGSWWSMYGTAQGILACVLIDTQRQWLRYEVRLAGLFVGGGLALALLSATLAWVLQPARPRRKRKTPRRR